MDQHLRLSPEVEAAVRAAASRHGLSVDDYLLTAIARDQPDQSSSARKLLARPPADRRGALALAAADAAPLYGQDLQRPAGERDLTAFTVLDTEDFIAPG